MAALTTALLNFRFPIVQISPIDLETDWKYDHQNTANEGANMRKVELMIVIVPIFFLLIGCAQPRPVTLKASSLEGQSLQFDGGRQHIFSKKTYSRIGLDFPTGSISYGSTVDFYIAVVNSSDMPFNFSTENITANCNDKSIYIFHADEALNDQDSKTALDLRGLSPSDVTAIPGQISTY
jgi:hypothetical protein